MSVRKLSTWIVATSLVIGLVSGAMLSMVFTLLTVSVPGRNAITGEAMELRGLQAVFFYLAEYGPAYYLASLLPVFLVVSTVVTAIVIALRVAKSR